MKNVSPVSKSLGLVLLAALASSLLFPGYCFSAERPYVLRLGSEKAELMFVGISHTFDPGDPQVGEIVALWKESRPSLAMSEGGVWPLESSSRLAVCRQGEQGLLRYLAALDKVPVLSLDESMRVQARYLCLFFRDEKVKMYFLARAAILNRRGGTRPDEDACAERILGSLLRTEVSLFNAPPKHSREINQSFSRDFPELADWREIPDEFLLFPSRGKYLADIHAKLQAYRERAMMKAILTELKKGRRIFALAGRSHVLNLECALKAFFDDPQGGGGS